jgi:hypothetical protein
MTWLRRWQETVLNEVSWQPLGRALLALSPFIALFIFSRNTQWLATAALISICTTITQERLSLAPVGVVLHGMAIMFGFIVLIAASAAPPLFVGLCAMMATAAVWLMSKGHLLRSLGNFTFIPALYLACETIERSAPRQLTMQMIQVLPYIAIGLLPVVLLAAHQHSVSTRQPLFLTLSHRAHIQVRLSHKAEYGQRRGVLEACIAVTCAVGLAATLVEWQALDHGQWVIWSAASVVTGEAGTEHKKFHNRITGALIGVPLGVIIGCWLPHIPLVYGGGILAGLLTLIAFKRYIVGFGARCLFIALTLTVGGGSIVIAGERIFNVILGGLIGVTCVFVLRQLLSYRS